MSREVLVENGGFERTRIALMRIRQLKQVRENNL